MGPVIYKRRLETWQIDEKNGRLYTNNNVKSRAWKVNIIVFHGVPELDKELNCLVKLDIIAIVKGGPTLTKSVVLLCVWTAEW